MFARYVKHWAGDGSLFPTVRTPAQCFMCFLMYIYAYFNFIICMCFFTSVTCFVINTVLTILSKKKMKVKRCLPNSHDNYVSFSHFKDKHIFIHLGIVFVNYYLVVLNKT